VRGIISPKELPCSGFDDSARMATLLLPDYGRVPRHNPRKAALIGCKEAASAGRQLLRTWPLWPCYWSQGDSRPLYKEGYIIQPTDGTKSY